MAPVPFRVVTVERSSQPYEHDGQKFNFFHVKARLNRGDIEPTPGQVHKHVSIATIQTIGRPAFADAPIFNEIHVGCTLMLEPDFDAMEQPYVGMTLLPASKL